MVRFNKEAKDSYMEFATSPQAVWAGNFRDLSASVTRMATLADAGRINDQNASEEIKRLQRLWSYAQESGETNELDLHDYLDTEQLAQLDLFDAVQLQAVLAVCLRSKNMSEAGRKLFAASRSNKANPNDADRLKKYLNKFGLHWDGLRER